MKEVNTNNAPAAIGPYSQGMSSGNLVFLSGQLGIDPETGKMLEGVEAQTTQAFKNIQALLESEGLSLDHVVKVLVLLSDISHFSTVNDIYAEQFSAPFPARSAFAVKDLPLNGLVEIEVIAERSE